MIKIEIRRKKSNERGMEGDLYIDGELFCNTLENPKRAKKIKGETAIPAGHYTVIWTFSPKFQQVMPLLCAVPDYEGVRLHWGNYVCDTDGCPLMGRRTAIGTYVIWQSRATFCEFVEKVGKNKFDLTITDY